MHRVIAVVTLVAALPLTGFAATNAMPGSRLGSGAAQITGYTVANVTYHLDDTDPGNLASVEFHLDASARGVKVRLQSVGGSWYSCLDVDGSGPGNRWSCPTPGQTVQAMDELRIIAVQ